MNAMQDEEEKRNREELIGQIIRPIRMTIFSTSGVGHLSKDDTRFRPNQTK